jgi:putative copper export protein
MLPSDLDTLRAFLHVLAATIWVGGQLTLAGLVPGLRGISADAPRAVARRFNRIAWPAYAVLVATGVWTLLAVNVGRQTTAYHVTVFLKLTVVALSGISAAIHAGARSKGALAVFGALSGVTALLALFLGVVLDG